MTDETNRPMKPRGLRLFYACAITENTERRLSREIQRFVHADNAIQARKLMREQFPQADAIFVRSQYMFNCLNEELVAALSIERDGAKILSEDLG